MTNFEKEPLEICLSLNPDKGHSEQGHGNDNMPLHPLSFGGIRSLQAPSYSPHHGMGNQSVLASYCDERVY